MKSRHVPYLQIESWPDFESWYVHMSKKSTYTGTKIWLKEGEKRRVHIRIYIYMYMKRRVCVDVYICVYV